MGTQPENISMRVCVIIVLSISCFFSLFGQPIYNIEDFGAKGDGATLNTEAINRAIRQCHQDGGGTVWFPAGKYLTGSFEILSNIELKLDAGCTVLASPNLEDYHDLGVKSENRSLAFIYADSAENISISGRGVIDGNDMAFFNADSLGPEWFIDPSVIRQGQDFKVRFPDGPLGERKRPGMLLMLIRCSNVVIEDVTVLNAPNWNIHLACCKYVDIHNINVRCSLMVPNASGIDVSQSQHIRISGCTFIAGDDAIAISPCADGFCNEEASDIVVTNCTMESRSAGVRLGWAQNDIRNCVFQNLVINGNRGICINARMGETIENVIFSDIIINTRLHTGWWGKAEPIHISQIKLDLPEEEKHYDEKNALIKNISFSNIIINSEAGILLYSYYPDAIQDIRFDGINMTMRPGKYLKYSGGNFDLRPTHDIKLAVFKHDIPAFYFKGTKDVSVNNFSLKMEGEFPSYYTNGIYGETFSGFRLSGSRFNMPTDDKNSSILLKNGDGVTIDPSIKSVELKNVNN